MDAKEAVWLAWNAVGAGADLSAASAPELDQLLRPRGPHAMRRLWRKLAASPEVRLGGLSPRVLAKMPVVGDYDRADEKASLDRVATELRRLRAHPVEPALEWVDELIQEGERGLALWRGQLLSRYSLSDERERGQMRDPLSVAMALVLVDPEGERARRASGKLRGPLLCWWQNRVLERLGKLFKQLLPSCDDDDYAACCDVGGLFEMRRRSLTEAKFIGVTAWHEAMSRTTDTCHTDVLALRDYFELPEPLRAEFESARLGSLERKRQVQLAEALSLVSVGRWAGPGAEEPFRAAGRLATRLLVKRSKREDRASLLGSRTLAGKLLPMAGSCLQVTFSPHRWAGPICGRTISKQRVDNMHVLSDICLLTVEAGPVAFSVRPNALLALADTEHEPRPGRLLRAERETSIGVRSFHNVLAIEGYPRQMLSEADWVAVYEEGGRVTGTFIGWAHGRLGDDNTSLRCELKVTKQEAEVQDQGQNDEVAGQREPRPLECDFLFLKVGNGDVRRVWVGCIDSIRLEGPEGAIVYERATRQAGGRDPLLHPAPQPNIQVGNLRTKNDRP